MGAEDWNRRYAGSELLWTAQPNRFLVAEAAGLPPGRALDLACGEGRNAVWLAEQGWQVTGVDFSDVAIGKAEQLATARRVAVTWEHADLLGYLPERHGFDLVILFYVQLPETARGPILRAAAEAIASDGTLLLVAHDSSNLEHGHGGPSDPAVLYTAADVAADLADSGLRVVKAEVVRRPVETPAGERIALDALVRARRD
jgi:SAM-dependent methyltransferase